MITKISSLVILTGAGISAESGLETFRGAGGLWCGHRVEDVATPEAFARNPQMVHDFYNMRRAGLRDPKIQPNAAHQALARLEREWDGDVLIVTQNIDDLHERAGTRNLIHMHGEVLKMFCAFCANGDHESTDKYSILHDLGPEHVCVSCNRAGGMRPDIVWFGEMPYAMNRIERALMNCDLFIAIGTSGNVYPAAGFVQMARYAGAESYEYNLDPALNSNAFDKSFHGPAG
ncbi:MAG: NAD-dependent deacylase, partial [Alphaproteobacteria bacterium]|nr:NAD-dependent deacylase [Alphaproteobacteria bacterium]